MAADYVIYSGGESRLSKSTGSSASDEGPGMSVESPRCNVDTWRLPISFPKNTWKLPLQSLAQFKVRA